MTNSIQSFIHDLVTTINTEKTFLQPDASELIEKLEEMFPL